MSARTVRDETRELYTEKFLDFRRRGESPTAFAFGFLHSVLLSIEEDLENPARVRFHLQRGHGIEDALTVSRDIYRAERNVAIGEPLPQQGVETAADSGPDREVQRRAAR